MKAPKRTPKEFAKFEPRIKAWACVDSESGVVGVFETRQEARESKQYAATYGHTQKVARLIFEEYVR